MSTDEVYLALYYRHGSLQFEEFRQADESIGFLNHGSEHGECSPVGVIEWPSKRVVEASNPFNEVDVVNFFKSLPVASNGLKMT